MKALVLKQYNTPPHLEEVEKPAPKKGEVLVKIEASGINPLDLKIVAGQAAHARVQLPAILGLDMAGTVEAVGEGVDRFKPGDEVFGMVGGIAGNQGTLAEYIAADADLLALKPPNITFKEAAALPLISITAWEALVDRANVTAGKTVLVHGGAGGVGHIAIQIAKAAGALVYATGKAHQAPAIENYGATPIDFISETREAYMEKHTNGQGFDIVLDTVGGSVLDASFSAVKRYTGHVVSILGWGTHSLAPLSFRGATYSGVFTLYPLISGEQRKHHGAILSEIASLATAGKLRAQLDQREFSMETIGQAFNAMKDGSSLGKIVVMI